MTAKSAHHDTFVRVRVEATNVPLRLDALVSALVEHMNGRGIMSLEVEGVWADGDGVEVTVKRTPKPCGHCGGAEQLWHVAWKRGEERGVGGISAFFEWTGTEADAVATAERANKRPSAAADGTIYWPEQGKCERCGKTNNPKGEPGEREEDRFALWAHCVSMHSAVLPIGVSFETLKSYHENEHRGPGGIRNHEEHSREFSYRKLGVVLAESSEP